MSFLISKERSIRACAVTGTSLLFYDGGSDLAGSLIAALKDEPNQVQDPYGEGQIVVALWDVGLFCYDFSGKILWKNSDILRVERIVYSEESETYFVKPEGEFVTVAFNNGGQIFDRQSALVVNAAFNAGRMLLTASSDGLWAVKTSFRGRTLVRGSDNLKKPIRAVAGNDNIVAIAVTGGGVDFLCLQTGRCLFSLQRQNWFGVSSVIQTGEISKFRALVSDWDSKPMGAVIEIDVKHQTHYFISASKDWNWDSRLLNNGSSVLRFFANKSDHFFVVDV